jgi:hypothetical protein
MIRATFDQTTCTDEKPYCDVGVHFEDFGNSPTLVYLALDNYFFGQFSFAKSMSFGNLFKTLNIHDRDNTCHPLKTAGEFKKIMGHYGFTKLPPKIQESLDKGEDDKEIFPCGIKAALYYYQGRFS